MDWNGWCYRIFPFWLSDFIIYKYWILETHHREEKERVSPLRELCCANNNKFIRHCIFIHVVSLSYHIIIHSSSSLVWKKSFRKKWTSIIIQMRCIEKNRIEKKGRPSVQMWEIFPFLFSKARKISVEWIKNSNALGMILIDTRSFFFRLLVMSESFSFFILF